ncbi:MAG TPA: hypothetical protein VFW40_10470 [Capsulimonadaceae bacterium]|nr:hypothetical protein [Capsulimonadaceae bacterium]
MPTFYRRLIPYLVLAALPCILLYPVLLGRVLLPANLLHDVFPWRTADPKALVPWNVLQFDGIAQFYPWRLFAAQTWRQGFVPLWNPYEFCGTPFLANSQSAVLYPLNLLFVLLPVMYAFGASAILHLFLTGAFLYAFLRRACGLSSAPALLGAAVWQLSTWQVSWLALPTFLCTSCWLPLALLLTHRLAERPSFSRAAALGLTLGVMLLAGHLQIAFYCLLLIVAYAVFSVVRQRVSLASALPSAVLIAALTIMIAAPQLLPVLELSQVSHRAGAAPTAAGYAGYVGLALPARHLATLFLPGLFGHPNDGTYWDDPRFNFAEVACYVGVLAFILALLGLFARWRESMEVRFFAISGLIALLLALGTPLDALLYFGVPGFGQTGSPARILVLWTLCLAILAAFGCQALLERDSVKKAPVIGAFIAALVLFGLAFGGTYLWIGQNAPKALADLAAASTDIRLYAGLFLASAAIAYFFWKGSVPRRVAGALLIALAAFDLIFVNFGYNPAVAPADVYPQTPLTQWLAAHAGDSRIMPVNRDWSLSQPPAAILPPNAATVYGLPETQGYDSLQTGRYVAFASALDGHQSPSPVANGNMVFTYGAGSREARDSAARYMVSLAPITGFGVPLYSDGVASVYEDKGALPMARMEGGGTASVRSDSPTRVHISYNGQGNLVVAEQWYPGWKAYANGKSAVIVAGPEVFRTVAELEGPSGIVEMRYAPTSFRVGLFLMCAALLVLAAAGAQTMVELVIQRPRARRAPHSPGAGGPPHGS